MASLTALRATAEANTAEQKRNSDRKRNLLVLMHAYMIESGHFDIAAKLNQETGGVCVKYEVADNIDLGLVLIEYENYYEMRYDRKPKLVRKLNEGEELKYKIKQEPKKTKRASDSEPVSDSAPESAIDVSMGVTGIKIGTGIKKEEVKIEEKLLKPPPQFGQDAEMKQLAAVVSREIYQHSTNVSFDDIIGLDEAKRLLKEAIQLPLEYPSIFTGILRPWKGILLHGPPGTGKTLLAKAVAAECNTTFFNISASTLVSKWRGDSEKLVRVLFELASYHAPSVIFMDEIDAILSARGGDAPGGEHEASRRMKTELLIQMDGIREIVGQQVFVMAASNVPWDLDVAVLRRLEKRVLVSLPTAAAREQMVRKNLEDRAVAELSYADVAEATEGYSGSDIEVLCREAAMMPVRRLLSKLNTLQATSAAQSSISSSSHARALRSKFANEKVDVGAVLKADSVSVADMTLARETTKASSSGSIAKYEDWQKEFGSV